MIDKLRVSALNALLILEYYGLTFQVLKKDSSQRVDQLMGWLRKVPMWSKGHYLLFRALSTGYANSIDGKKLMFSSVSALKELEGETPRTKFCWGQYLVRCGFYLEAKTVLENLVFNDLKITNTNPAWPSLNSFKIPRLRSLDDSLDLVELAEEIFASYLQIISISDTVNDVNQDFKNSSLSEIKENYLKILNLIPVNRFSSNLTIANQQLAKLLQL